MVISSSPGPTWSRGVRRLAAALATATLLASLGVAGVADAAPRTALINGDTVYGAPSQEEDIAAAAGFTVTVVDDATWAAMTAAQFGAYDLLIAGDPYCGALPPGLVSSASVYGPVVLGLDGGRTEAGNRVLVGTDPVLHDGGDYSSPNARGTIIREGIAYAGSHAGTTGMYFDSTCGANYDGQSTETLAIVDALSAGSGSWTIDADPPCGGAVSLIASNPSFADLTTASLEGWSCSVHESFPTFRSDWSALAVATDTLSHPTCGVDPAVPGVEACGEAYILISGTNIVVNSLVISVTPPDATNPVGTDHTVTANVHEAGGTPVVAGQIVAFSVTGVNGGATGTCAPVTCISDASGNVTFTYHDTNGAGDDTIKASFSDAAGSLQTATAQKHWTEVSTKSTSTTYTGGASTQYSDGVTLSGTLLDTSGAPIGIAGKQLDFTLGTQSASASPTDAGGNASTSLVVTQMPGSVTTVETAFAGDVTYAASSDSDPFVIDKEDCTIAYTGDTLVNAAAMTNLSAQFGELDATPGDWTAKTITFTVTDAASIVQTFTAMTNAAGVASTPVALGPNDYSVGVSFAGDDFYLPCASAADTLVTVSAGEAQITGGGWISQDGGRTSFGFNAGADGTGLHGELQVSDKNGKDRFHGASVLTLDSSGNSGTWTGTGRWDGVDGYTFTVAVVDNGTSGKKGDTISIVIKDPTDVTVFTTGGPQPLKGGNIVVH